jgi:thiol:disulfide interchange protein
MSSMPPYGEGNPYPPSTQYPPSGYPTTDPYAQPAYGQPAYGQQVYVAQPQYVAVPVNDPGSGQALAGMILGIAGLFLSFFGLVPLLGLIFSIIGMRSVTRKGMAIAGLVMSIIGLVAAIFFTILIVGLIIAAANTPTY